MKLNARQIQARALEILKAEPDGIRWSELLRRIGKESPLTPPNSIQGSVHGLITSNSETIKKIARGVYRLAEFVDGDASPTTGETNAAAAEDSQFSGSVAGQLTEQDFYASFSDWLVANDEATSAVALGGSVLGGKWGTPDVIGVLRPRAVDIFKFEPQITSAEIKIATNQPLVAFGQAVAYRLFSHKSYVVVPEATTSEDIDRIKSLCIIHGVGLVTFKLVESDPDFTIIVPPQTAAPDVFYVTQMLERLKSHEPELLEKLFP